MAIKKTSTDKKKPTPKTMRPIAYAKHIGVSRQTVDYHLKKGHYKTKEEGGITFIKVKQ